MDIAKLKSREEIPLLLNDRGLHGTGVELGAYVGVYSECLLFNSRLSRLYTIDSWHEAYGYFGKHQSMEAREGFGACAERLWRYFNRSVLIRMPSPDATVLFADKSLDFMYIDANHSYEAVTKDIEAWWPKMKPGGIFAGHDYDALDPGTIQAVNEFRDKTGLKLYLTECDFTYNAVPVRSWLFEVPNG